MPLLEFVEKNTSRNSNGCWEWQLSFSSNGYPQKKLKGRVRTVHRALAEELGIVCEGELVRHTCNNYSCCNPSHLVAGTFAQNYQDSKDAHVAAGVNKRKRWQVNGVEFDTCRAAVLATGITMSSIIKFTSNGVFDVEGYRASCAIAHKVPKV